MKDEARSSLRHHELAKQIDKDPFGRSAVHRERRALFLRYLRRHKRATVAELHALTKLQRGSRTDTAHVMECLEAEGLVVRVRDSKKPGRAWYYSLP